jgi:hypothetical protein
MGVSSFIKEVHIVNFKPLCKILRGRFEVEELDARRKTMQKNLIRRFQGIFACTAVLVMMLMVTACAGTGGNPGQPTTGGATVTTVPTTQGSSTATQSPTGTQGTQPPVAFKPGGISFIGPVKSISSTSLVMSAPNGQTYTMAITVQTDRTAYGGNLPTVGNSVDMDSAINPDGSLSATILKPAQAGDPDLNVVAYTGVTTSAVGADRVLHFTVGTKSYTFTIPQTAVLTDFGGNAQAIVNNMSVKVKIQYPANTVVSVGNASAGA